MKFLLFIFGVLCFYAAIQRLLLPDPDGTLDSRNHDSLMEMKLQFAKWGVLGQIAMPIYWAIYIMYLPFYKPSMGLLLGLLFFASSLLLQ